MATETRAIVRYRNRPTPKRRVHHRAGFTLPLAAIAGLSMGMVLPVHKLMAGKPHDAMDSFMYAYTPFDPWSKKFSVAGIWRGLVPAVMGLAVHKYVGGQLGVNRMLKRAGVPIVRL